MFFDHRTIEPHLALVRFLGLGGDTDDVTFGDREAGYFADFLSLWGEVQNKLLNLRMECLDRLS